MPMASTLARHDWWQTRTAQEDILAPTDLFSVSYETFLTFSFTFFLGNDDVLCFLLFFFFFCFICLLWYLHVTQLFVWSYIFYHILFFLYVVKTRFSKPSSAISLLIVLLLRCHSISLLSSKQFINSKCYNNNIQNNYLTGIKFLTSWGFLGPYTYIRL